MPRSRFCEQKTIDQGAVRSIVAENETCHPAAKASTKRGRWLKTCLRKIRQFMYTRSFYTRVDAWLHAPNTLHPGNGLFKPQIDKLSPNRPENALFIW